MSVLCSTRSLCKSDNKIVLGCSFSSIPSAVDPLADVVNSVYAEFACVICFVSSDSMFLSWKDNVLNCILRMSLQVCHWRVASFVIWSFVFNPCAMANLFSGLSK